MRKCPADAEPAVPSAQTQFQIPGVIANRALDRRHAGLRQPQDALLAHLLTATWRGMPPWATIVDWVTPAFAA